MRRLGESLGLLIALIFIAGCTGNNGFNLNTNLPLNTGSVASTNVMTYAISGTAMLGSVSQATVSIYGVSNNGTVGSTALAQAQTDSSGNFTAKISGSAPSGPVVIKVCGGSYTEEASAQLVPIASNTCFHSIMSQAPSNAVAVTPLTEMAYAQFTAQMSQNPSMSAASVASASISQVAATFGLADIVNVVPGTNNNSGSQYELVIAGLSQSAKSLNTDSLALTSAYAQSLASNGTLQNVGNTYITVPLTNPPSGGSQTTSIIPPTLGVLNNTLSSISSNPSSLSGVTLSSNITVPSFHPEQSFGVTSTVTNYFVTPSGPTDMTISPSSVQSVAAGAPLIFTVTPPNYYSASIDNSVSNPCPQGTWSGSQYSTGAIKGNCNVAFTEAPMSFTVTYNGNGNTGGSVPTDSGSPYIYNSSVSILGNTGSLVQTGYTFAGWNTAANGRGTSYAIGSTLSISANMTLYAQWSINTYTVTYNGNGNTGGLAPSSARYNYNSTATIANIGSSFVKNGYTFSGWNTAADGSGTSYAVGSTFTVAANITLYAQWLINTYTLTPTGAPYLSAISSSNSNNVNYGSTGKFAVSAATNYTLLNDLNDVTGTCPKGTWSGSTYTTGTITSQCTIGFTAGTCQISLAAGSSSSTCSQQVFTDNFSGGTTQSGCLNDAKGWASQCNAGVTASWIENGTTIASNSAQPAPTITSFSSNVSSTSLGQTITLSYATANLSSSGTLSLATKINSGSSLSQSVTGSSGSLNLTQTAAGTITYTLTATNSSGSVSSSVTVIVTAFSVGSGTSTSPYQVSNAQQLNAIGANYSNKFFELTANIDLTGISLNKIDISTTGCTASCAGFNGNGFTINYLVGGAIFSKIEANTTVQNLGIANENISNSTTDTYITSGEWSGTVDKAYTGGLADINYGSISNCYTSGAVSGGYDGGLVGGNYGTVTDCYSSATVIGSGGLVGVNYGTISNSYASGAVSGSDTVGGFVGENSGNIINSYATGAVSGVTYIGGFVGTNQYGPYEGTITNCYASGAVSGSGTDSSGGSSWGVGGLAGQNYGGAISNSYASGAVSGVFTVGGLVGYNMYLNTGNGFYNSNGTYNEQEFGGTITNSYASGAVSSSSTYATLRYVGGLVGQNSNSVTGSYWNTNATCTGNPQICANSTSVSSDSSNSIGTGENFTSTIGIYSSLCSSSTCVWNGTSSTQVNQPPTLNMGWLPSIWSCSPGQGCLNPSLLVQSH